MGKLSTISLLCVGLITVTFVPGNAQDWGEITEQEEAYQPPIEYPDANAVILFDRGRLTVTTDGITIDRHVRIKVFNSAGAEEAADIRIAYLDGDKITGLKAQTITPGGKKHKVNRRKVHKQSVGSTSYRTFSFPAVEDGAILEYRYTNANKRFSYLDPWYFQNDLYTVESSFTLALAPGFTYSSLTMSVPGSAQRPVTGEDVFNE